MPEFGFGTPFAEQLDFFVKKLALPSERWDDIKKAAHDRAFIVAGAAKADLLNDLQQVMAARIADGRGLDAFRKDFRRVVAQHGWTGWTGEGSALGEAWRTRVIYQTNMATSYAAGRYKQLTNPAFLELRPYWRYVHADGVMYPRPHHLAWGQARLTLRYDHPFWKTHFPPNGWGCHCYVIAVEAPDDGDATEPQDGWNTISPKTGAPVGIDKGFDYQFGAGVDTSLRDLVAQKLISYPPAITRSLTRDLNRYLIAHDSAENFAREVLTDRSITDDFWLGFPENSGQIAEISGKDVAGYIGILPADVPRHVERSHGNDGGDQRPIRVQDYNQVWRVLNEADELRPGHQTVRGLESIVAYKVIDGEQWRAVFEIRPGKRSRLLALVSLVIKTT